MPEEKTGLEKARETAQAIKNSSTAVHEEKQAEATALAKNETEIVQADPELLKMYVKNANAGAENLSGDSPLLKIHQVGKSSTNTLADGKEPNNGWFFYKPTEEQFETLECHILTISAGFRAPSIENKDKLVFNQIMAGVIVDGYKPFLMYLTGKKLNPMWEFGKEAKKYTHAKPFPIPMFALSVKLSTFQEKNSVGMSFVPKFEIVRNENGSPKLVTDIGEMKFLQDHLSDVEATISGIVEKKNSGQTRVNAAGEPVDEDGMPF